jgi:hypothetical protein
MVHEAHLEPSTHNRWRPTYVRNQKNFANRIEHFRKLWAQARTPNQYKAIASNFNKEYNAWIAKVHAENVKRRREESDFFAKITRAKRQGPASEERVLAAYGASLKRKSPTRVSKSAPPERSGKRRNTSSLRKSIAARSLVQRRKNLMAEKKNLEAQRNNLERRIDAIINKLRELPS